MRGESRANGKYMKKATILFDSVWYYDHTKAFKTGVGLLKDIWSSPFSMQVYGDVVFRAPLSFIMALVTTLCAISIILFSSIAITTNFMLSFVGRLVGVVCTLSLLVGALPGLITLLPFVTNRGATKLGKLFTKVKK